MSDINLNRKLTLETPNRVPDAAGGFSVEWVGLGEHWGRVVPGTGREKAVHTLPRSHVPLIITVRAAPTGSTARPLPGQRFREGTRIYAITAVTERDQTGRYLTCHAEEEVVA